jgi:cysteinyl-tRNA synthetase
MTIEHLGIPIDIHGGGKDLVFPHHTNEIAQSVAAQSEELKAEAFVHHWMHHGFVEIDDQKMSKSLGTFFTIREVLARYDAEALRLFLLGTHYRNDFNFSDVVLGEAEKRLGYLYETLEKADRLAAGAEPDGRAEGPMAGLAERGAQAMDDDFNTAAVLGILADAFTAANALADRKGKKTAADRAALARFAAEARELSRTLGILQRPPAAALLAVRARASARRGIDPAQVERKIAERAEARKAKDFARSDSIRAELLAIGVSLRDDAQGTTWTVD